MASDALDRMTEEKALRITREVDRLTLAMLDAGDVLAGLSMATDGLVRSRVCSALNRLNHALGRTISSHGDQPCPVCGTFRERYADCGTCAAPERDKS